MLQAINLKDRLQDQIESGRVQQLLHPLGIEVAGAIIGLLGWIYQHEPQQVLLEMQHQIETAAE